MRLAEGTQWKAAGAGIGFLVSAVIVAWLVVPTSSSGTERVSAPNQQQVFRVRAVGGGLRQVTSGPAAHDSVSWASGGTRLVMGVTARAENWVESVDLQGGAVHRLTESAPESPVLAYAPATRQAADVFDSASGLTYVLEVVGPPGAHPSVLDRFPDVGDFPSLDWSPDGHTLAYTRPVSEQTTLVAGAVSAGPDEIVVWNLRTGRRRSITGRGGVEAPLFSPNGHSLLFMSAGGALASTPSGGGPVSQLTTGVGAVYAAWSPNGKDIALIGYRPPSRAAQLFVLNLQTRRLKRLVGDVQLVAPTWSPNGQHVAFASSQGAVEIINSDGTGARTLVSVPNSETDDLSWSPTGSQIAFSLQQAPGD